MSSNCKYYGYRYQSFLNQIFFRALSSIAHLVLSNVKGIKMLARISPLHQSRRKLSRVIPIHFDDEEVEMSLLIHDSRSKNKPFSRVHPETSTEGQIFKVSSMTSFCFPSS